VGIVSRHKRSGAIGFLVVVLAGGITDALHASSMSQALQPAIFRVLGLPDSQYNADKQPGIFINQTTYACAQQTALIPVLAVFHEGDVVDNAIDAHQWQNASDAMGVLERCGMPYTIPWGNHDKVPAASSLVAKYFPASRLMHQDFANWLGHLFFQTYTKEIPKPTDRVMATGQRIRSADEHGPGILLVALNYLGDDGLRGATTLDPEAGDDVKRLEIKRQLRWFGEFADLHPSDRVWLTTHADLETPNQNGALYGDRIVSDCDPGGACDSAGYDWIAEHVYLAHANIDFVFSGHTLGDHAAAHRVTVRPDGSVLNEVLFNAQSRGCLYNGVRYGNCGNGWLRDLTVDVVARTVNVQTYSPWVNRYETGADGAFMLAW
jgi:hypothetical protein